MYLPNNIIVNLIGRREPEADQAVNFLTFALTFDDRWHWLQHF